MSDIDDRDILTPLSFRVRFKSFIDQYELRELHFHSLMRTKELEVQFHMSRVEREKKAADAEVTKSRHLQAQVQAFTKTETELRNQLNVYVDKFKQVRPSSSCPPAGRFLHRCWNPELITDSLAGRGHAE